jgi:crotonobetainyl-CoA:carnitine CoA-transferase CaiB-like acyl-CoA transferase
MWRKYLKIIEKERKTFVSSFEHVNFNKSSVVLDLTKGPEAIAKMLKLISEADVFITNVRLPALQKLGLDYASIKDSHPHIVYGHLSAWVSILSERERVQSRIWKSTAVSIFIPPPSFKPVSLSLSRSPLF